MIEVYTTMRFYYYNMTKECIYSCIKQLQHKLPITSGGITFYEIVSIAEFIEYTEITIKGRAPAEFINKIKDNSIITKEQIK